MQCRASRGGRRFWYGCVSMVDRMETRDVNQGREELRDVSPQDAPLSGWLLLCYLFLKSLYVFLTINNVHSPVAVWAKRYCIFN